MHAGHNFAATPSSVAGARQFVARTLREWGLRSNDAVLLVSELATNAVLHAHSDYVVDVNQADDVLRVAVTDANPDAPTPASQEVPPDATGGRGLALVVRMARRWGYELAAASKTVWFEVYAG